MWPHHAPWGTPSPTNAPWASNDSSENSTFPFIESLNRIMPGNFNGMTYEPFGVNNYPETGKTGPGGSGPPIQGKPTIDPAEDILDNAGFNAGTYAIVGHFTGGSDAPPYLFAPAYRELLEACSSGITENLRKWYDKYFTGPAANWDSFLNGMGLEEARKNLERDMIRKSIQGFPPL